MRSVTDTANEIDRLYGLPLDEFVAERDALAKRLRAAGERETAEQVKALRKPTAGAWALNQAVRRRRSETEQLLEAGERLRASHEALLGGGGREGLRAAMERERELAAVLADCAEAIASETGKSGAALKERVRATLHAAALDEEVREELAQGRLVREREAVGLGGAAVGAAAPRRRPAAPRAERTRAGASQTKPAERVAGEPDASAAEREAAEHALAEARSALAEAEAAQAQAAEAVESARTALREAEEAERDARRLRRERERDVTRRERELARRSG
jgi:hypothetical protein